MSKGYAVIRVQGSTLSCTVLTNDGYVDKGYIRTRSKDKNGRADTVTVALLQSGLFQEQGIDVDLSFLD